MTAYQWNRDPSNFDGESGSLAKYNEPDLIDFSDSVDIIQDSDRDTGGAIVLQKETAMSNNKGSRRASYIGQLSSGHDAKNVDDYKPGANAQAGKAHEEEVDSPNWYGDKRDEVGKAASGLAGQLRKIADNLDKFAKSFESSLDGANALSDYKDENDILVSASINAALSIEDSTHIKAAMDLLKSAEHPIEHADRQEKDDPKANADHLMGDDEWVDIGPGEFDDKRDEVGRADKSGQ